MQRWGLRRMREFIEQIIEGKFRGRALTSRAAIG
jgi:hypothetical protein